MMESDFQLFHCALLHILPIYFFCGGKFQLSVCRSMNPLFDVALCRSTPAYYTAVSTAKLEQRSFCSAQNHTSFGVKLAYGVVLAGNPSKEKAWNFSVHQEVSGFVFLKLEIYCSIGFIVGNSSTSRIEALSVSSMTRRSTPKPRPPVGGRPYSSALT